jgi:hypothetical protein
LGIFGINMPLLYGEGEKAFLRLQKEIAQSRNDLTLFAWQQVKSESSWHRGLFATSPLEFQFSARLRVPPAPMLDETEFSITNRGVRFNSHICIDTLHIHGPPPSREGALLLGLDCMETSTTHLDNGKWVAIFLRKLGANYFRYDPWSFSLNPSRSLWRSQTSPVAYITPTLSNFEGLQLQATSDGLVDFIIVLKRYVVSCDGELRPFITFSVPEDAKDESTLPVGGAVWRGPTVIYTRSFLEILALHQFDFKFTPDNGTEPQAFMLLTGCSDTVFEWDTDDRRRDLFWYALFLVDREVEHWSLVSGAVKSSSDMDVSNPEFQDYLFARFSNNGGIMKQLALPTVVDTPGNNGRKYRVSAEIRGWDGHYQRDAFIAPAITLGYKRLRLEGGVSRFSPGVTPTAF